MAQLINGIVYHLEDSNYIWISRFVRIEDGDVETAGDICIEKGSKPYFYPGNGVLCLESELETYEIRQATWDEINHYEACQKANKYVPSPEPKINNSYEIF